MQLIRTAIQFFLFLFSAILLHAQQETIRGLTEPFDQYRKKGLQEKLYVHTDKDFFLAGEIIWFKIYYVDGNFHKPLDVSKVAYVEILDKNNKPLMQIKTALKKGTGGGTFFLPASVTSGIYRLRAYTNWMKNFGAGYFFEKPV